MAARDPWADILTANYHAALRRQLFKRFDVGSVMAEAEGSLYQPPIVAFCLETWYNMSIDKQGVHAV